MEKKWVLAFLGIGILFLFIGCTTNGNPTGLATLTVAAQTYCTDSDNGSNIYTLGYVNGICADCTPKGITGSNSDTCIAQSGDAITPVKESEKLMEFYCTNDGWVRQTIVCPNGCLDGACNK